MKLLAHNQRKERKGAVVFPFPQKGKKKCITRMHCTTPDHKILQQVGYVLCFETGNSKAANW